MDTICGNKINTKIKKTKTKINGIVPDITSEIGLLTIPAITYKTIPIGGVINAISIFTTNKIANQIGSMFIDTRIGYKIGTMI
jgi:hypothetical protein